MLTILLKQIRDKISSQSHLILIGNPCSLNTLVSVLIVVSVLREWKDHTTLNLVVFYGICDAPPIHAHMSMLKHFVKTQMSLVMQNVDCLRSQTFWNDDPVVPF